jgi:hypothetical protein
MFTRIFMGLCLVSSLVGCAAGVAPGDGTHRAPVAMPSLDPVHGSRWVPVAPDKPVPAPGVVTLVDVWHPS